MSKPDRWAIALCAPDRETDAAVALFRAGEKAAEIRPTRFLARSSDVILIGPAVFDPLRFEFAPAREPSALGRYALMPPIQPPPISSVVTGV